MLLYFTYVTEKDIPLKCLIQIGPFCLILEALKTKYFCFMFKNSTYIEPEKFPYLQCLFSTNIYQPDIIQTSQLFSFKVKDSSDFVYYFNHQNINLQLNWELKWGSSEKYKPFLFQVQLRKKIRNKKGEGDLTNMWSLACHSPCT